MWGCKLGHPFLFFIIFVHIASSFRIKSYNLNQLSSRAPELDCVHTSRNVSLPKEFTLCFRYKKLFDTRSRHGLMFLGSIENGKIDYGILFGFWSWTPWLGIVYPKMNWAGLGYNAEPSLLTWIHTCLVVSLLDGTSIMYENGVLISKKKITFYEELGAKYPNFVAQQIYVGCDPRAKYPQSDPGLVTDFQIFGRKLQEIDLQKWTRCDERLEGDILSWDTEDWIFNKTGNGSNIEFIDFHNDVCTKKNTSFQLFPVDMSFHKTLDLCKKVGGKMNE